MMELIVAETGAQGQRLNEVGSRKLNNAIHFSYGDILITGRSSW